MGAFPVQCALWTLTDEQHVLLAMRNFPRKRMRYSAHSALVRVLCGRAGDQLAWRRVVDTSERLDVEARSLHNVVQPCQLVRLQFTAVQPGSKSRVPVAVRALALLCPLRPC